MRRWRIVGAMTAFTMLGMTACAGDEEPVDASTPESTASQSLAPPADGRIVFQRFNPSIDGPVTFTVSPDGTDLRPLYVDGHSEGPRWSPDGTLININCCDDGMVAHLVASETGEMQTTLSPPDPTIETFCGGAWSPDGERLACEAYGVDDPSRNGIYSIRVADGQGLTRITSNPGGEDIPGDYSPDGTRLVFFRVDPNDDAGLFVINVDGSGLVAISKRLDISPDDISDGDWSPAGDQILFAARRSDDHHKTIWIVNADGSALHELRIDSACGGLWSDPEAVGCYSPAWSPDGTKIVYVRSTPAGEDEGIYVANADGSGSIRVTEGEDDGPDWGMPPA